MSCIICFLSDGFHERLRNIARLKSDRFEAAIEEYKKLFISEFESICDVSDCSKHKLLAVETVNWCAELQKELKLVENIEISGLFDSLGSVYIKWVEGEFSKALGELKETLKKSNIFQYDYATNAAEYIFCMRGRKSTAPLVKEDLFHIPFNKRYLISNQRFSINGLPLLYLALSPIAIYHELRAKDCDLNDLYFSSYIFKYPRHSLKIADLTNRFSHFYSDAKSHHDNQLPISFRDSRFDGRKQKDDQFKQEFLKFILSSVCSFKVLERFEGNSFVEEYVLPQLLSEYLRKESYDGLSYSSTRVSNEYCYSEEVFHVNKYRENIVLFTKYSGIENYDTSLLDKFNISRPVRLVEINDISYEELERLKREIFELNEVNKKCGNFLDLLSERSGDNFKAYYEKLKVKDGESSYVSYKRHELGKIHLFLLYQNMLAFRNDLKGV